MSKFIRERVIIIFKATSTNCNLACLKGRAFNTLESFFLKLLDDMKLKTKQIKFLKLNVDNYGITSLTFDKTNFMVKLFDQKDDMTSDALTCTEWMTRVTGCSRLPVDCCDNKQS